MTDGDALASPVSVSGESATAGQPALTQLYAELTPEIHRLVLGVVRDPELADDVMQATFVKAIEQGHQARLETSRGWLFQVAFREALAAKRRQGVRDQGDRRLAGFRPRDQASPETGLLRGETVAAVRNALGKIPDEQRQVILARIYEDKTFAEIASESGLPLGTVLTRMRRGLEKLRHSLNPGG